MSYRDSQLNAEIDGVPTYTKLRLLNGTTPELVINCNYVIDDVDVPILLTTEGYTSFAVAFEPAVEGLSAVATIDPADESIVRVVFTIKCPSAVAEDVETSVSVLAIGTRTDCILRGTLEIEDAPLVVTP